MQQLFHIVSEAAWASVPEDGDYRPESLAAEGFVHLSFRHQVAGTLARFYPDRRDLVVLELDPERLADRLVVEDRYGHGQEFPHLYGPVPTSAVVAVHRVDAFAADTVTDGSSDGGGQ